MIEISIIFQTLYYSMPFYLTFQKDQRIAKLVNGVHGASVANHVALENKLETEKLSDIQNEMENLVLN